MTSRSEMKRMESLQPGYLMRRVEELEQKIKDVDLWLERIQGKCGIPDAGDACRNIIKYVNECRKILREGK